jgi:outer membrane protein assembly factor BamB/DNA-directed RNA polymerase subunit RPC12/RpoP
MIRFHCECGQKISVHDRNAGRRGKCPKCGKKILVPTLEPPPDSEKVESIPLEESEKPEASKVAPDSSAGEKAEPPAAATHKPGVFEVVELEKSPPGEKPPKPISLVADTQIPQKPAEEESYDLIEDVEEAPVIEEPARPSIEPLSLEGEPQRPAEASAASYGIADEKAETAPKIDGATVGVCLNCNKPVSIQAYQQLGYYCSAECKSAVRARTGVSQMVEDTERAAAAVNLVRTVILAVIGLVVVAGIAVVAYLVLPRFFKPVGEFALAFDPRAHISKFAAGEEGIYLVAEDGELSCIDPESLGIRWAVPLEGNSLNRIAPVPVPGGVIAATTAGIFRVDAVAASPSVTDILSPGPGQLPIKLWADGKIFVLLGPQSLTQDEVMQTYAELSKPNGYPGMGADMIPGWPPRNPSPGASHLVALDPASGKELWRKDLRNAGVTDVVVHNGKVWFATTTLAPAQSNPPTLIVVDENSGAEAFQKPLSDSYGWHLADSDAGMVLAGKTKIKVMNDDGDILFEMEPPDGELATKVAVSRDRLAAKGENGTVSCYDLSANGKSAWSRSVGAGVFPPIISGGKVLASGIPKGKKAPEQKEASRLTALYKQTAERLLMGSLVPKPLPDLTCFDLSSGNVLWVAENAGERFVDAGKFVYALWTEERKQESGSDRLYRSYITALNARNGETIWGVADMGISKTPPLPYGGDLYIHLFNIDQTVTSHGVVASTYENRLSKVEIK